MRLGASIISYQRADRAFIDYQAYRWGRRRREFRGPRPDLSKPYIAFIGSASTYGRYVERPYGQIVADRLGLGCANFGVADGGPDFFLSDSRVMEALCEAQMVVVEVMSARSLSNRLFSVTHKGDGRLKGVSPTMQSLFPKTDLDRFSDPDSLIGEISSSDPGRYAAVEKEMKTAWLARTRRLLSEIAAPTVLFWFSQTEPPKAEPIGAPFSALRYPQHVDRAMLAEAALSANALVSCASRRGMPQNLMKGDTAVLNTPMGMPLIENRYYPSPEMHEDAAEALIPRLAALRETAEAS